MILADTSVWVDHLRRSDAQMRAALDADEICMHPMVIGEIACGNLRNRTILVQMQLLQPATVAAHDEVLAMIEQHKLMGRGVGFVDIHLLASAKLSKAALWTRDKRLAAIGEEFRLSLGARGLR